MARRTVRIDIPRDSVDDMLDLTKQIVKEDGLAAADKKLNTVLVASLQEIVDIVEPIRIKAKDFEAQAQAKNQLARNKLGIEKGQAITVIGTGLNLVNKAKKNLLDAFENNEEVLTQYGFKVVVGTAKSPVRKPKE